MTSSDTQPLHRLVSALLEEDAGQVHVRCATPPGVVPATTLCEIAPFLGEITIEEERLPIRPAVNTACEMIGLDPLYLANEGKMIVICDLEGAEELLQRMRRMPEGRDAALGLAGWASEARAGPASPPASAARACWSR